MFNLASYTAAGEMPWKLLQHKTAIKGNHICPIHIQLIPTNKCNRHCEWCSCADVDRKLELPIQEIQEIYSYFAKLGTASVTITGGGEPTTHPDLEVILSFARQLNIQCGMVSNGILIPEGKFQYDLLNQYLTWLRISVYDNGKYDKSLISRIALLLPDVDIGISYTVTSNITEKLAYDICTLAEQTPNITHVRFVEDILHSNDEYLLQTMGLLEKRCRGFTKKAIFQYRNIFTRGIKPCLISLLKPIINADGYIYPCCGVQYASNELRTMPEKFKMCHWSEFKYVSAFDGSICSKCYYDKYNQVLDSLTTPLAHGEFV